MAKIILLTIQDYFSQVRANLIVKVIPTTGSPLPQAKLQNRVLRAFKLRGRIKAGLKCAFSC